MTAEFDPSRLQPDDRDLFDRVLDEREGGRTDDVLSPPGRHGKPTKVQIRERMLLAAASILDNERTLVVNLDVHMEHVALLARLQPFEAQRVYPTRADLVADVLALLARRSSREDEKLDAEAKNRALSMFAESSAGGAPDLLALIQTVVGRYYEVMRTSAWWHLNVALLAGMQLIADDRARQRIALELQRAQRRMLRDLAPFYEEIASSLGMTLKPGVTSEQFVLATAALLEGLAVRQIMIEQAGSIPRAQLVDDPGGRTLGDMLDARVPVGDEAWSLAAWSFLALVMGFFE